MSTCHEEVTRQDEAQPCEVTAVALRYDVEGDIPYPVCARHVRPPMVSLADMLAEVPE